MSLVYICNHMHFICRILFDSCLCSEKILYPSCLSIRFPLIEACFVIFYSSCTLRYAISNSNQIIKWRFVGPYQKIHFGLSSNGTLRATTFVRFIENRIFHQIKGHSTRHGSVNSFVATGPGPAKGWPRPVDLDIARVTSVPF